MTDSADIPPAEIVPRALVIQRKFDLRLVGGGRPSPCLGWAEPTRRGRRRLSGPHRPTRTSSWWTSKRGASCGSLAHRLHDLTEVPGDGPLQQDRDEPHQRTGPS